MSAHSDGPCGCTDERICALCQYALDVEEDQNTRRTLIPEGRETVPYTPEAYDEDADDDRWDFRR